MPEDLFEESPVSVPHGAVRMVQPHGLHAGSCSDENCDVVFFSERVPQSSESPLVESYNPDVQRTAIQVVVELQTKIWPTLSLDARHVMMKLLQAYVHNRPSRPTEVLSSMSEPAVTNVAQWLWDCHQNPDLYSNAAASEIMNVIASSDKEQFSEACAHFMERERWYIGRKKA